MKIYTKLILSIVAILIPIATSWANIQWRYLSTPEGLSNRRVYNVTKDLSGYIWFATRYGVDRYDGNSITSYELPNDKDVVGVIADNSGQLIAYSKKGIYKYDDLSDCFALVSNVSIAESIMSYTSSVVINDMYIDSKGGYWVSMNQGAIYSNDLVEWSGIEGLETTHVICFTQYDEQTMLVGTRYGLRCVVDDRVLDYDEVTAEIAPLQELNNIRIQHIWYDKQQEQLWIGTFSHGLYLYDIRDKNLRRANGSGRVYPIRAITLVDEDEVWVGMNGVGIKVHDRLTGQLKATYTASSVDMPLSTNSIYSIFCDENIIYISTYSRGVMCYNNQPTLNQYYLNHQTQSANRSDPHNVNYILEDSQGYLWLATNSGLLRTKIENSIAASLQSYDTSLEHDMIMSLFEDRDGDIWVGGYFSELICYREGVRLEAINLDNEHFTRDRNRFINTIMQDRDGYIYFGGVTTSLSRYCKESGEVVTYPSVTSVEKIFELNSDKLLISSYRGLNEFDKRSGTVRQIAFDILSPSPMLSEGPAIINIIRDPKQSNILWLGSGNEGLIRYNSSSGEMTQYTIEDGLPSNAIYGGIFDSMGRLWVSSESGISCVEIDGAQCTFNNFANGDIFNIRANCLLKSGNILYSNLMGIIEINPKALIDEVYRKKSISNLHFNEFRISYDKVLASQKNSPLNTSIDNTESMVLKHNQNSFSFYFADVNTHFEGNIKYQYRLVNFEEVWTEPSSENRAIYTNISPGTYRFEVRALDPTTGKEGDKRGIDIKILPPIYFSVGAYIIYVLLTIIIATIVILYIQGRIERRNADDKINFFINMAHDIRIPITLVMAPLNELESESDISEDGRNALSIAKKNINKLFKLVTELLDFQRIALQERPLMVEQTEINKFIKNSSRGFALMAHEKRIDFCINLLNEATNVWIDRDNMAKVLENLLSNAVKYTTQGGVVTLDIRIDATTLTISVSDTGIGIPAKSRRKIFTPFYRAENTSQIKEVGSGIGLLLTKKMVILHHGRMTFTSKENEGSTFVVDLPYNRSQYDPSEINETSEEIEEAISTTDNSNITRKLLIVEDNDELRIYLARYLRRYYVVEEATNGLDAIEKIASDSPDIIVSDIIMPKMNGTDLCKKVKGNIETSHIPFIILSSVSEKEDIVAGLKCGADDYITKPFDLSILESKISTILTNRSLARRQLVDSTAFDEYDKYIGELDKDFLRKVVDVINDNLTNPDFSIDTLAQHTAMSRSVFFKKFKSLTDQSPKDFIRDIKMKQAGRLICEQKLSIAEVAYCVGFPDAKYFSTAFKKYYGVTPTSYLEQTKKELNR